MEEAWHLFCSEASKDARDIAGAVVPAGPSSRLPAKWLREHPFRAEHGAWHSYQRTQTSPLADDNAAIFSLKQAAQALWWVIAAVSIADGQPAGSAGGQLTAWPAAVGDGLIMALASNACQLLRHLLHP